MAAVQFFTEGITFRLPKARLKTQWLKNAIAQEGKRLEALTYIFCSDAYLLQINQQFLKHNTYTDIITFDYSEGDVLQGEIYISIERVRENAAKYKVSFNQELARVMIHGVLHLAGYRDKRPAEKALMRKKEEAYLSLLS
jgi:rRNA maturation RNase YbeY